MSTIQIQHPPQRHARRQHRLASPKVSAQDQPATQRRGLDFYVSATRLIEATTREEAVLEQVQQLCVDECIQYFRQVEMRSCQELPPEAISQIHPPERCWLVRLAVSQEEEAGAADEVQGIVSLWEGALHLLLR